MTLESIKDIIENVSNTKNLNFDYGEEFLIATGKVYKYPMCFLEIPVGLDYDMDNGKRKDYSFAVHILMKPGKDNVKEDFTAMSEAEDTGDSLFKALKPEFKAAGIFIESLSGIVHRKFSSDNLSGARYDITVWGNRSCN